jgi:hypothetical protein
VFAISEPVQVALIAAAGSAIVSLIGASVVVWQASRNTKAQRSDHALTAEKVDELVIGQTAIRDDPREMKADLRDVKDEVRSHGDRLRNLEHMTVTQDHTDEVVRSNGRKLQQIQDHQNREQAS